MTLVRLDARGPVRIVTLDDPDRRNILSADLCRDLAATLATIGDDADARVVVITGNGPAFSAGADLSDLERAVGGETEALHLVYQSFMDVAACELPTIAAVNGAAVGAGFNLALACDMRMAGERARFDCRFLKIGLHPGGGHGWMLERAVGWARATRMLLLDQPVDAGEAVRIGLAEPVAAGVHVVEAAVALAERTAALPRALLTETKRTLRHAVTATHDEAFQHETAAQLRSLSQPPFMDLMQRLRRDMAEKAS